MHCMDILWSGKHRNTRKNQFRITRRILNLSVIFEVLAVSVDCLRSLRSKEPCLPTSDFSLGVIWIRISDPVSLRSWYIKETVESTLIADFSAPRLMYHDPIDLDH